MFLAYHIRCSQCASQQGLCAKCSSPLSRARDADQPVIVARTDVDEILPTLRERDRRTVLRKLGKKEPVELSMLMHMQQKANSNKDNETDSVQSEESESATSDSD